jgi:uncharacterized membrane protein
VAVKTVGRSSPDTGRVPRHRALPVRQGLAPLVLSLALIPLLVPFDRLWAVQLLLVPLLLIIPGVILLRTLRVPGRAVASFPVYVPCASVVVLFCSGLAVDLIGPLLGIAEPIRAGPLLVGLEVTCLGLLAGSVNASPETAIPWSSISRPGRLAWPLIVPIIAAAGALRLNSGHSDAIALTGLCACAFMVVAAIIFSSRLDKTLLAVILYAAELAMMWSYSLRGDLVYGFDIATEYYDLHRTVLTGVWHVAHPGDAYGAMLSVTVMPSELHFLSGVPDLLVLKVVYPAISALLPVAVFGMARRILSRRWAFAAAASVVIQATFAQELPAIARQEIALLLFAALTMAMLDNRLERRTQWMLVGLLSVAMALSHYSTTYVAIVLIGLMLPLQFVASWRRGLPHVTGAVAIAFLVSCAGAVIWYGPVTHSAAGLGQLAQSVDTHGFDLLPNRTISEGSLASYLQGNAAAPISAAQYSKLVATQYASLDPFITPLADASAGKYALHDATVPMPQVKSKAGYDAVNLGSLVAQQLVYLLSAIGALMLVLRRKAPVMAHQVGLIALSSLVFLGLIRLSGTLAVAYNQERALLQTMTVLVLPMCWCLQTLAGRTHRRRGFVLAGAAALLSVLFIGTSGLLGAVLGGGTATNLANSGEDYERFYMTTPELASAQWLGQVMRPGQLVYADRYAQLPLIAMTGINRGLYNDVTPETIDQHAWVYASTSNIVGGRARALFNGERTVTYVFPIGFLRANYDLVYTDGSSEVFHR